MTLTQEEMGDLVGPLSISIATRDAELKPHFARAFGIRMSEDQKHMTVMVPKIIAAPCLKDIENNKLIAATVAHMANFKTRQYKGTVQEIKDCTESDYELMKTVREAGAENSALFFGPKAGEGWRKYVIHPAFAITFELSELFDQSPGIKAGEKLK
ncbi:hypothetical protein LEP1GSC060_0262 [Leptospira weilii serovar Ranarum str. ICFT]|uniref:Uncharacterized protein n=1 Tax=Leptospira weilii serovar Ranarum str. ICFT TaxID=1218598 RepID=N1WH37_9LEPT|nr:hypothetical protein [Leptospira weilii]EMY76429.1 hypothetical protein LEP1GSC060_0262 [Leptospira weilii serovar Ranarum str. ICFT]